MKSPTIYLQQAGLKSLGFDPGPLDGVDGPKTRTAEAKWLASLKPKDSTYLDRWFSATLDVSRAAEIKQVVERILSHQDRYEAVAETTGVPWYIIACLHNMESGGSFARHLHEGSSLNARTKFVPEGRPVKGNPPFTWEESAIDALTYDKLDEVNWSSLNDMLYACEKYNGLGYVKYHPETPSPYLWAATSVERPGKYVEDGKWSPTARSKQIGVVAILKSLESQGRINLPS